MRKIILHLFVTAFILTIIYSCKPSAVLYKPTDRNKAYTGFLYDSTITILKSFLARYGSINLKDTIVIKYDYNNEICWDRLDAKDDDYIMGFINRHQQQMQKIILDRPNLSVFTFREPGNNLNKIKMWDKSILIDSSKQLYNLLFYDRSECGNSILIMPDRKFIFIRSDAHSQILDITTSKIQELLNKQKL